MKKDDIFVVLDGEYKNDLTFIRVEDIVGEEVIIQRFLSGGKFNHHKDDRGYFFELETPNLKRTYGEPIKAKIIDDDKIKLESGNIGYLWNGEPVRHYEFDDDWDWGSDLTPPEAYLEYKEKSAKVKEAVKNWDGNPYIERPAEYII